MFVPYVELHAHSAFSFLDGASLPDELAAAAAELGYGAMALTDHNSVSGSMEFAQAAGALGLRAIHGVELDLDDGRHITLLVEDRWWNGSPVRRRYWEVVTTCGRNLVVFHDLRGGGWLSQR